MRNLFVLPFIASKQTCVNRMLIFSHSVLKSSYSLQNKERMVEQLSQTNGTQWESSNQRQYRGVANWNRTQISKIKLPLLQNNLRPSMSPSTTITDLINLPKFAMHYKEFLPKSTKNNPIIIKTVLSNTTNAQSNQNKPTETPAPQQRYTGDCRFCKGPHPVPGLHHQKTTTTTAAPKSAKECPPGLANCVKCCGQNR